MIASSCFDLQEAMCSSRLSGASDNLVRRHPRDFGTLLPVTSGFWGRRPLRALDAAVSDTSSGEGRVRRRRSDAEENIRKLVRAAMQLLQAEPEAGLEAIAVAAGVSRSTIYRHFSSREELVRAAGVRTVEVADANQTDALRPPGELVGGPTPLDVADALNKVPPHLLGEQIVAEAQRLAGVTSVALYLVDIDGSLLLRLAGSEEFPSEIAAPLAVGAEIPREGLPRLRELIEREVPDSVMAPLLLRGRALGVLLAVDAPEAPLVRRSGAYEGVDQREGAGRQDEDHRRGIARVRRRTGDRRCQAGRPARGRCGPGEPTGVADRRGRGRVRGRAADSNDAGRRRASRAGS